MRGPLKPKEGLGGGGGVSLAGAKERLLLLCPPPPPPGGAAGAAAGPPARQGALLELGLPLAADPAWCRARFHRRSKVLTVTMPLRA
ncbi:hypothetical protein DV515_00019263 [Chloebia gouldiae]|uniref:Uncharacterized protein n=1 Tax=Chloebia gouldiae TaxID=44316 RepID=A0A3L8Q5K3_CHLGU|nr:hypothetical protein DV515_00019263 [Chloebia gouldiae]